VVVPSQHSRVSRPSPRERLLQAGQELTYRKGIGVGVDAILKKADVARRSLYEHFAGKDGLIVEILRASAADDERRYREALDSGGNDPRARLLRLFETIERLAAAPNFRGCRYTAATLTLPDDHPARAEIAMHKERVRLLLRAELAQMGSADPDRTAGELLLLIEGALAASANRPGSGAGHTARVLAERTIENSTLP
jgi:AcrR family transcriptional regulator